MPSVILLLIQQSCKIHEGKSSFSLSSTHSSMDPSLPSALPSDPSAPELGIFSQIWWKMRHGWLCNLLVTSLMDELRQDASTPSPFPRASIQWGNDNGEVLYPCERSSVVLSVIRMSLFN